MDSAWIEIDKNALRKNLKYIQSKMAPGVKLMGIVKGNCYGYGVKDLIDVFLEEGATAFGVVLPVEGYEIRKLGYQEPILVLGYVFPGNYKEVLEANLTIGLDNYEDAIALNEVAKSMKKKVGVHIRVDSGMGRLGYLSTEENAQEVKKIFALSNLYPEGIMTHFSLADEREKAYTTKQFDRYMKFVQRLENLGIHFPIRHAANSGATCHWKEMQLDMIRVGSLIYGIYPSESMERDKDIDVKQVMTFKGRIVSVKNIPDGECIGYGCTYQTKGERKIGVVPTGYVDGIYRTLANRGEVLVHGKRAPIVGKICMDQMMIDITNIPDVKRGDEVVIFGKQGEAEITLDEHARMTGQSTTPSGVVNRMGARVPIYYKE